VTYSQTDPIELPTALVAALHRFDGRATPEVLAAIEQSDGLAVSEDLVQALVDFAVLEPCESASDDEDGHSLTP
jgi:hypothetical protein